MSMIAEGTHGKPVVGFHMVFGDVDGRPVVRRLEATVEKLDNQDKTVFMAKKGYAVSQLELDHDQSQINAVRLVFVAFDGDQSIPSDTYRSPWIGTQTNKPTETVGARGAVLLKSPEQFGDRAHQIRFAFLPAGKSSE